MLEWFYFWLVGVVVYSPIASMCEFFMNPVQFKVSLKISIAVGHLAGMGHPTAAKVMRDTHSDFILKTVFWPGTLLSNLWVWTIGGSISEKYIHDVAMVCPDAVRDMNVNR